MTKMVNTKPSKSITSTSWLTGVEQVLFQDPLSRRTKKLINKWRKKLPLYIHSEFNQLTPSGVTKIPMDQIVQIKRRKTPSSTHRIS